MAGKSASKQNQKPKKSSANKNVGHPWFTLVMSTLGCLVLVVGLYYANKANNLKSKELKKDASTGEQKAKRSVYPTETPTQSMKEPSFGGKEEGVKKEFKNNGQTSKSPTKSSQTNQDGTQGQGTEFSSKKTATANSQKRDEEEKKSANHKSNEKKKTTNSSGSSSKSNATKKQQANSASLSDFKRVPRLDGVKVRNLNSKTD